MVNVECNLDLSVWFIFNFVSLKSRSSWRFQEVAHMNINRSPSQHPAAMSQIPIPNVAESEDSEETQVPTTRYDGKRVNRN